MEEKISLKALEDYSEDYASKVTASFFSSKSRITGPEILKLCDVNQVNLFVIRELLHAWKHESQKLRSPYFDYSHPSVAEALTRFQNLLSNHISITRESFQPLLQKAVRQTLYLIFDPYDYFADTLDRTHIQVDELRDEVKYVKINRTPLEKLLNMLEQKGSPSVTGNEAFACLDEILEEVNFQPEDIEAYLISFSKVVPLEIEALYNSGAEAYSVSRVEEQEIVEVKIEPKEEPKPDPVPVKASTPTPTSPPVPISAPAATPPPRHVQGNLYEQLNKPASNLAEDFQKRKKIKDSLTINQKFMFTKILFNGDFELFSTAIDRLDQLDNLDQARKFLENNYGEWNKETEEYQEFNEMIERRFAQ